ncbi:hypothetical protein LIER_00591 [Lithospermum erythrorhizon]|uniref:Uncharacterized protein n=1 Tax=Lithospermum erythrorhizon TaxID=34254 RepID=A0AAV3NHZ0_LITER
MAPTQSTRAQSDDPRPLPGLLDLDTDVRRDRGPPRPVGPCQNPPHQSAPSMGIHNPHYNYQTMRASPKGRQITVDGWTAGNQNRQRQERSTSSDSDTRKPNHCHGYDLTTFDSSHERSPLRENRQNHKGNVTSQSLYDSTNKDKAPKDRRGKKRHHTKYMAPDHSSMRDAGGSNNADLQKPVDELKALLKDITPGRGPVKHSTLLPFSD